MKDHMVRIDKWLKENDMFLLPFSLVFVVFISLAIVNSVSYEYVEYLIMQLAMVGFWLLVGLIGVQLTKLFVFSLRFILRSAIETQNVIEQQIIAESIPPVRVYEEVINNLKLSEEVEVVVSVPVEPGSSEPVVAPAPVVEPVVVEERITINDKPPKKKAVSRGRPKKVKGENK